MKKIFTALIFLFALALMTTVHAETWRYATVNAYGTWYVDSDSITIEKDSEGELIFFALVKQEPSAQSRSSNKNVAYIIFREEFKLSDGIKYFRVGATTNYTFDGEAISDPVETFDWDIIPENSAVEFMYNTAYRFLQRD